KDAYVRLYRADSVWNYQFLLDKFGGGGGGGGGSIQLNVEEADIENLRFVQMDAWKGKTLIGAFENLHLLANNIDLDQQIFDIRKLEINRPEYREFRVKGLWSAQDSTRYYQRLEALAAATPAPDKDSPQAAGGNTLQLNINELLLHAGIVEIYNRQKQPSKIGEFDERDILIDPIEGSLRNVRLQGDSVRAQVDLVAHERSGLDIKRLQTNLTLHPQGMEFANLDLQLNDSRLGPYFAMRYADIEDMEDFTDKVSITARLANSQVSMQDIAYFAPDLKDIKQVATLSGTAQGAISNFTIAGLDLRTGQSQLKGAYTMKGLTDIDKTIINFETPGSQIDLKDVEVWAPDLRSLRNSPLGNMGLLTYAGTYEGTVFNFLAKGRISSQVGTINTTLRMKLDKPGQGFTATVHEADINGGALLQVPKLGRLLFNGEVASKGLSAKEPILLKGHLKSGSYYGYNYQDIDVDGKYLNDKLEVELGANDLNLLANIKAVLDFKQKKQSYNARGSIGYANLHALNFTKDTVITSGLFDADFKGTSIDDFLGYARIYDAQVTRNGQELSLDSFYLASSIDTLGQKLLSLRTNEAEADIRGIYNLSDLPNGFQLFLSRYYPAVIKPPKTVPRQQHFTFNVTTRQAEPLLAFVDPNIQGLNYATLVGSIDLNGREMFANADVPFFKYGDVSLSNTSLKAQGSDKELSLAVTVDNVSVNDDLAFPSAVLNIDTRADTTAFSLTTRSQGPLGDAALAGTFYSLPDGFDVRLKESSFIVNNNKWTINKDAHFALRNGYLVIEQGRLSNNQQQITLVTQPSGEGNWNDLNVHLTRVNLGDFLPFVLTEPKLEGQISGQVKIINPLGKSIIDYKLDAHHFYFNNDSIGLVNLEGQYNTAT
ncbi:MAG TPA: hypothetical protein PKD90_09525, partial [Phnomibacter sp.]|nr:hypothetical protein [Phnomibacter sp.]